MDLYFLNEINNKSLLLEQGSPNTEMIIDIKPSDVIKSKSHILSSINNKNKLYVLL